MPLANSRGQDAPAATPTCACAPCRRGEHLLCVVLAAQLEAAGRPVLQLTYSAALKPDWRARRGRSARLGVPHTFHSFAYALAGRSSSTR